jgi:hypothetical protein
VSFRYIKQKGMTLSEGICLGEGEGWSVAAFDGFEFVGRRQAETKLKFLSEM